MKRIMEAHILQGRVVRLRFDDGLQGTIDFARYPTTGVFRRWEESEFFSQMRIARQGRSLEWPGEIDLCADSLWIEAGCGAAEDVFTQTSSHAAIRHSPLRPDAQ